MGLAARNNSVFAVRAVPEVENGGGDMWGDTQILELARCHVYPTAASAKERDSYIATRSVISGWGGVLYTKQGGATI